MWCQKWALGLLRSLCALGMCTFRKMTILFTLKLPLMYLVISSNKKGGLKMLPPQDKTWLVNHTQRNPENIEKLYKEFQIDYPNGGIYRRLVANMKPWNIVFTLHHSSLLQAVCRILPSRIGQPTFLSQWNVKRIIKSVLQVTLHFCDHIFRTLGKDLKIIHIF